MQRDDYQVSQIQLEGEGLDESDAHLYENVVKSLSSSRPKKQKKFLKEKNLLSDQKREEYFDDLTMNKKNHKQSKQIVKSSSNTSKNFQKLQPQTAPSLNQGSIRYSAGSKNFKITQLTDEEKKFIEERVQRNDGPRMGSVKSDMKKQLYVKKKTDDKISVKKTEQPSRLKKKTKIEQKDVVRYFKGLDQEAYSDLVIKLRKCFLKRLQQKILKNEKQQSTTKKQLIGYNQQNYR